MQDYHVAALLMMLGPLVVGLSAMWLSRPHRMAK